MCPQCGVEHDALTGINDPTTRGDRPQVLIPCICGDCGAVNLLFPGPTLVKPTAVQRRALMADPCYPTLIALRQLTQRQRLVRQRRAQAAQARNN